MALSLSLRTEVVGERSLHCGNRNLDLFGSCDHDLDPTTFTYKFKPYPMETYGMCDRTSYVKVFESYRKGGECVHLIMRGHFRSCESTVSRRNKYQPKGGDVLRLGSKGRYGSCVSGR